MQTTRDFDLELAAEIRGYLTLSDDLLRANGLEREKLEEELAGLEEILAATWNPSW